MTPDHDNDLRELLPALRRFALWLTRDPSSADDLVQTCIEKALSRWATRRDGELKAWLFAILYRQFVDDKRHARRWNRLLDLFGRDDASSEPSAEDTYAARHALGSFDDLSDDQRAVLLMVTVEGLSYEQTASALDIPVGTVMSRLSRARKAYRQLTEGGAGPALRRVK
ncbi:MAG TPA: sigma-70 family RNA polymerase sigma factor [Dyella sp.]|uniref:sigma-70 family RNA polymerase sigma factor n=1 Tax=Dyella sp. TaxID=1869338 RepID=UPI002F91D627